MLGRGILQAASVRKGDFAGLRMLGKGILQPASVRKGDFADHESFYERGFCRPRVLGTFFFATDEC